jgi:hypothetical protein
VLSRAGLRGHFVTVNSLIAHGRIQKLSTVLIVDGRYESLGVKWTITASQDERPKFEENRAYGRRFHITSEIGGEGFGFYATSTASEKDLLMRHANPRCLFSFRGCSSLCEILPYAIPAMEKHVGPNVCTEPQSIHEK